MNPAHASRLPEIDVLRGLALFGIVLVNVAAFRLGIFGTPFGGGLGAAGWRNGIADALILWLVTGKFILIFSFLFGWGIHTLAARDGAFRARYRRRLLGLALIGLAHAAFLFSGDILVVYAILGLFMLRPAARDWPVQRLVRSAVVLSAVQVAILLVLLAASLAVPTDPGGEDWFAAYARQSLEVYRSGGFWTITLRRLTDFAVMLPMTLLLAGWGLLAMFRLGLAAAKAFAADGLEAARGLARRVVRFTLVPGLLGNGLCAVFAMAGPEPWASAVAQVQYAVFAPVLALAYLAAAALLLPGPLLDRLAPTLGAAGRMSLSVYVGQSAVLSLIFYGYGLGLAGSLGSAAGVLVCVAVYAGLVAFAAWWLARFRIGPLEWVLRSITEARAVPLRRALPAAGASVPAVAPRDRGGGGG